MLLLVLGFLVVCGWAGVFVFRWVVRDEKRQADLDARADEVMNDLFTGEPQVVYEPGSMVALKASTLAEGASAHGYRMVSDSGDGHRRRVLFERV